MKLRSIIIFAAAFILLFLFLIQRCNHPDTSAQEMIIALQDSLHYYKDEQGRLVAYTRAAEGRINDFLEQDAVKSKTIAQLKELVSEQGKRLQAATALSVTTEVVKTIPVVVKQTDTITQYVTRFKDRWIDLLATTTPDSTRFQLTLTNELLIWHQYKKSGLFKPKQLYVYARSASPYARVSDIESYKVPSPKLRRWGLGIMTGYGVNKQFKPDFFIGTGLFYRLL